MDRAALALDIGGTKIAAGVVRGGRLVLHASRPTPSQDGPTAILDAAWALAQTVLGDHRAASGHGLEMLGVSSAGVIDTDSGRVVSATDILKDWAGTEVQDALAERSGMAVAVLNDVQAHAWGEFRHGAGMGCRSLLLVAVGTGIGGGVVVDGKLVHGRHHVAGHIGHVAIPGAEGLACSCGGTGHLEPLSSGSGIERRFAGLTGQTTSGAEIAALAARQDPLSETARHVLDDSGRAVGRVIGGMLNTLDPSRVLLTGSVTAAGEPWWDAVRAGVAADALPLVRDTPVVPGELHNAALVGAADWALTREKP